MDTILFKVQCTCNVNILFFVIDCLYIAKFADSPLVMYVQPPMYPLYNLENLSSEPYIPHLLLVNNMSNEYKQ